MQYIQHSHSEYLFSLSLPTSESCEQYLTVFYFDHEGKNWGQGPDLLQARWSHAAGLITDETTYDEFVIVTGGGYIGIKLDSTE